MTFRPISDLISATQLPKRPASIPSPHSTQGKKYIGLAYERGLASALPSALHNPWFFYHDANGPHYCSPDFILPANPKCLIILECKYTWCPEAHDQLSQLYVPVVSLALQIPTFGVVVCRNLRPSMPGCAIFNSFVDLLEASCAFSSGYHVLHWLGLPPRKTIPRKPPLKSTLRLSPNHLAI